MLTDILGNETTLATAKAVGAWDRLVEAVLAHARAAPDELGKVLAEDPLYAAAHAAKGVMLLMLARAELVPAARDCLAKAEEAARRRPVLPRERAYIDALRFWLNGQPRLAYAAFDGVLARHPRDALALKMSHAIRFMCGDHRGMALQMARIAPRYADDTPFAGYIQGCLAFALEENALYREAERIGRKAVSLAPRDAWGRHAVAHVLEMTGRARDGLEWLESDGCEHCNNFGYHIHWHRALFLLELGRVDDVLALHDHAIRADKTDDYRDLANGASLLQRLEIEGVDVGDRWTELAEIGARRVADRRLVFADLHYLTALLGAGRQSDADRLIANLLDTAREGTGDDDRIARDVGVATALGLAAYHAGDFAEAGRLLLANRGARALIGGSHAQRDMFEQVMLEALVRSGDLDQAERLLTERLNARGVNRFAAGRLSRIAGAREQQGRVAAMLVAAAPTAASH